MGRLTFRRHREIAHSSQDEYAFLVHQTVPIETMKRKAKGREVLLDAAVDPLYTSCFLAYRDEPLEMFDDSKVLPRIERARTALAAGDTEFASEILSELDAGGYFAPELDPLRKEIDRKHREVKIQALLTSAAKRVEEQEYQLALQKVDDILQLDPEHADALTLKGRI